MIEDRDKEQDYSDNALDQMETLMIRHTLKSEGTPRKAAERLGIVLFELRRRCKRLNIELGGLE